MTKIVPNNEVKVVYWFDGDKYLSSVMRENLSVFSKEFDLENEPVLNLLPECRSFARRRFLHKEALSNIVDYCVDSGETLKLNDESMGLFFWEQMEHTFCKLFASRFKTYVKGFTREEIENLLIEESENLDGASAKRLAMKKWGS